jgi:hypothetical protein
MAHGFVGWQGGSTGVGSGSSRRRTVAVRFETLPVANRIGCVAASPSDTVHRGPSLQQHRQPIKFWDGFCQFRTVPSWSSRTCSNPAPPSSHQSASTQVAPLATIASLADRMTCRAGS